MSGFSHRIAGLEHAVGCRIARQHLLACPRPSDRGELAERAPTDTIWFASTVEFADVQQARAHFDASGVPPTTVDINALLAEGERLQKRITDVEIVVESRILPDGTESIQYVVKLTVENCTEENFAGFGVLGAAWPPSVFVGERVADRTFFSVDEQVVVGEFDDEPEDGAEITLRYAYQRLTAPEPFQLP